MKVTTYNSPLGRYTIRSSIARANQPFTVFLHGGPGYNCFAERSVLGPELRSDLNFLWFDALGGGDSPAHSADQINWQNHVEDLIRIIDELAGGPVDVIAHCVGSHSAHSLARRRPELIRRAVFINPAERIPLAFQTVVRLARETGRLRLQPADEALYERYLSKVDGDFSGEDVGTFAYFATKIPDLFRLYWHDEAALGRYLELSVQAPLNPQAFMRLLTTVLSEPDVDYAAYRAIPVLVLQGENERITPWEMHGKRLFDSLENVEARFVPDSAHWPHLERPALVAQALRDFLTGDPAVRGAEKKVIAVPRPAAQPGRAP